MSKSLGDKKQSGYSFDVPFTQRERRWNGRCRQLSALVNEDNKPEATIDEKRQSCSVLAMVNHRCLFQISHSLLLTEMTMLRLKSMVEINSPVQFLKNGNTSTLVFNADNTEEETPQTAEERKAEENT